MEMIFSDEYVLYKPKTLTNELEDASVLTGSDFVENEEPTWLRDIQQDTDERSRSKTLEIMDSVDDPSIHMDFYVSFTLYSRNLW